MIASRRSLLASLASMAAMGWVCAQGKVARIAYLNSGRAATQAAYVGALREGLRDQGLMENRDYVFDMYWAEGQYERFPAFAAEAVRRGADVILVTTILAARAAQQATRSIPIVMTYLNDPVGAGLVASLARPGGNITGLANHAEDLTPKLLEILCEVAPKSTQFAVLFNPTNPTNRAMLDRTRKLAEPLGVTIRPLAFDGADGLDFLFSLLKLHNAGGLLILTDAAILDQRDRVAAQAISYRLAAIAEIPDYADAGILLSYGSSRTEAYRRQLAVYVKKILDGAKPAELPIQQPTRIELTVNLKTARLLGIKLPQSVQVRADRVIE